MNTIKTSCELIGVIIGAFVALVLSIFISNKALENEETQNEHAKTIQPSTE